jgi:hypothetical protein
MSVGADLIVAERQRQLDAEGYDAEHDRGHSMDLALAGATYALPSEVRSEAPTVLPDIWPWGGEWWKPTPGDRIRELVKAGALIAAAIDAMVDEGYVTQAKGQTDMGLG